MENSRQFGFVVLRSEFDPGPLSEEIDRAFVDGPTNAPAPPRVLSQGSGTVALRYLPMMCERTPVSVGLLDEFAVVGADLLERADLPGRAKGTRFYGDADGSVEELAVEVSVRAGDVIIFTEALVHGGCWRGAGSRRALFYKYAPGNWAHRGSCSRCRGAAKPRALEPPEGHQVGAWLRTARRHQPSETVIVPSSR